MKAIGYFADFVVFPIVLLGLAFVVGTYGGPISALDAGTAIGCGMFFWTFLVFCRGS
jgi:hypothetical protein